MCEELSLCGEGWQLWRPKKILFACLFIYANKVFLWLRQHSTNQEGFVFWGKAKTFWINVSLRGGLRILKPGPKIQKRSGTKCCGAGTGLGLEVPLIANLFWMYFFCSWHNISISISRRRIFPEGLLHVRYCLKHSLAKPSTQPLFDTYQVFAL